MLERMLLVLIRHTCSTGHGHHQAPQGYHDQPPRELLVLPLPWLLHKRGKPGSQNPLVMQMMTPEGNRNRDKKARQQRAHLTISMAAATIMSARHWTIAPRRTVRATKTGRL